MWYASSRELVDTLMAALDPLPLPFSVFVIVHCEGRGEEPPPGVTGGMPALGP